MDWHARFLQQADWTRPLREHVFKKTRLDRARRVLEVGCGTGAILMDLPARRTAVHGLDLEPARLAEARRHAPAACLCCGDALALPYPEAGFDLTFCHYLLLWVGDPRQALREMKRVTRQGGFVLALAEPDYDRRVDEPQSLAPLGRWQAESLHRQGADTGLGGRLAELFVQAGLTLLESGTLQRPAGRPPTARERVLEWAVLEADLAGSVPEQDLGRMKALDAQAWASGQRVLFVPTHFAWGKV